ncbi:hypothetical protein BDP27DRAFT_1314179 [Rhodocollybia butyracea]|uniref:Uncharacterized protein n=1 Tax=Rhodocollybia butyracea TaxID=206335 RepID=A0A9P5Q1A2_9AGAR|nr:hypothetical protein BDP27DRAFT_1314179 [Rhodocollybia butyracea]
MRNMGDTQYRAVDPPFRPPGIPAPESSLAVHYEPHTSDFRIPNRFASSSPSPSGSPVSSPRNLPPVTLPRSASPESVSPPQSTSSVYIEPDNRENSAKSDVSTRTFDSGTKFYEGL